MQSSWRIGAILGIPLFVDSSWFIILLLVTVSYGLEPSWHSAWGNLAWVMGFALALLLFASVLGQCCFLCRILHFHPLSKFIL